MHSEYAMAVAREPAHRTRRRTRRRTGPLKLAVLLAAALIIPAIWQGWAGGAASGQYRTVEIIYQNPELPNGCEVTSLAMLLASAGCPADKLALYQDYLPKADFSYDGALRYGPSPEKWYVGDATEPSGGWYCFESPVVQAANSWLNSHGNASQARPVTGLSRTKLDRYAQDGVPLITWVTLDYAQPRYSRTFSWTLEDGTAYLPYSNLHCVVLAGEAQGRYRVADPLSGFSLVGKDVFWDSFSAMGRRAVVIE